MSLLGKVYTEFSNDSHKCKSKPKSAIIFVDNNKDNLYLRFTYKSLVPDEHKYKINNNIKNLYTKQLAKGKFGIKFIFPSISVYIDTHDIDKAKDVCTILSNYSKLSIHIDKIDSTAFYPKDVKSQLKNYQNEIIINRKNYSKQSLKIYAKHLKTLKVVDLTFNSIKVYFKSQKFTLLTHLTITNCEFFSFESQLYVLNDSDLLSQLLLLDLSHNNIQYLSPQLFELDKIYHLQSLNMSHNKLQQLPNTMFVYLAKSLLHLNLTNNQLKKIPQNLGKLKQLMTLSLDNNKLECLPFSILQCTNLQKLFICNNLGLLDGSFFSNIIVKLSYQRFPNRYNDTYGSVPRLECLAIMSILKHRDIIKDVIPPFIQYSMNYEYDMCMCNCPFTQGQPKLGFALSPLSVFANEIRASTLDVSSQSRLKVSHLGCELCNRRRDNYYSIEY